MFATAGDYDLRGPVTQAVLPLEFVGDGLPQFRNSTARRVFGETVGQGLDRGFLDVLWRVEIRLARAETDHILAFRLHLFGFGVDGQGQRRRERGSALRDSVVH